ncbi:MAG: phage terminase large subunit family protein [Desulfobulbaceae bacterium]|nr:phage terminase large subunit family protein [Desulfobulbaceae bacterium]
MGFAQQVDIINPVVRLRVSPEWLAEKYRHRPERIRIKFRPTKGERRILRRHKMVPPSTWAPKHRTVTYGPLEGAKWDNDFMPHMVGIMDAALYPSVREIGNVKSPQGASSAGMETLLGFASDMRPGPALIVYPDKETAKKRCNDYLQPMFERSPRLKKLLTGIDDDMAGLRIKLLTMLIYMGWAGSTTSISNVSAMYLLVDEVNKMDESAGKKEGALRDYLRQRCNAYPMAHKIFWSSTPTDEEGHITQYMTKEAQVVFDYWVCCPDCGGEQLMNFDQIMHSFDKELTDPKVMELYKQAGYVCAREGCGSIWDDQKRDQAVIAAMHTGWRAREHTEWGALENAGRRLRDYLEQENPEKICFHSPAWISPLIQLWKIAAQWLKGRKDKKAMQIFFTQYKAEPFKDFGTLRLEDAILALRDDRPAGLVPGGGKVAALVAGVDTQDNGFYYVIRAFGWGMDHESWLVKNGEALTFEGLAKILFQHEYRDENGIVYPVHIAVQDTQGHRTSEVYDFSSLWPGRLIAYRGQQRKTSPTSWSKITTYPGTNKPIPGGVNLLNGDSTLFKNDLARRLNINPTDPGAFHLHKETSDEYASHMCAEYRDTKGLWQCPNSKPNHYWDCEYMALVAAYELGIKTMERPGSTPPPPKSEAKKTGNDNQGDNPFTGGQSIFGG